MAVGSVILSALIVTAWDFVQIRGTHASLEGWRKIQTAHEKNEESDSLSLLDDAIVAPLYHELLYYQF